MQAMRDYGIYGGGMPLANWLAEKYVGQDARKVLDLCVECGWCEEQCPQHLEIIEQIRRAKAALAEGA
jgi:predicted aldo/keto reductase-like oxidoreductase